MKLLTPILCLLAAAAHAQTAPEKLGDISQAAIQSAFQILRGEYIRSGELTFDELNRAALQGLLQRLDLGAELLTKLDAKRPVMESGVLSEMITPEIAYLRPLAFAESETALLETKLREHRDAKVPHVILDLRSAAPPGEFAVASAMLECFVPQGELLFKLKQVGRDDSQLFISHRDPVWTAPLLVLVDQETCNLGETIAAVLRQRKQALLIGSDTRGGTVRYETLPVDDIWLLRFARAEMLLADDTSLFKQGLKPDFPIRISTLKKRALFDANGKRPAVKDTLFDTARARYNEAALVARKNPELDEYIRRSAGQNGTDAVAPLRDEVLQRAVDMLLTHAHLDAMKLDWNAGPRDARPTIKKAERAP
jgi:C-terminal processing protease CtpA/Prc